MLLNCVMVGSARWMKWRKGYSISLLDGYCYCHRTFFFSWKQKDEIKKEEPIQKKGTLSIPPLWQGQQVCENYIQGLLPRKQIKSKIYIVMAIRSKDKSCHYLIFLEQQELILFHLFFECQLMPVSCAKNKGRCWTSSWRECQTRFQFYLEQE